MKEIIDPNGPYFPKWKITFIISCLFAVLLDPLFLYIPMINDDNKCMSLDRNLKIAAPVFRSVTDIFYIVNIIFQVYKSNNCSALINAFRSGSCSLILSNLRNILPFQMWKSYILIDVLSVLPLPQVRDRSPSFLLLIVFSNFSICQKSNARRILVFRLGCKFTIKPALEILSKYSG